MIQTILKSFSSLRHKAIWWLLLASVVASIFILLSFVWLINGLVTTYQITDINWIESLIDKSSVAAAAFFSWLLFPIAVPSIASLFEDKVAHVVEANEYGINEPAQVYPLINQLGYLIIGIVLNILILPIYIIPPLNIFAYYLVNSWLLGKSIFLMVATRHYGKKNAIKLWQFNSLKIKFLGAIIVFASTMPLFNLIAPLFGVIVMVHYSRSILLTK